MSCVQNNFCYRMGNVLQNDGFSISKSVSDTDMKEELFDTVTNSGKNLCEYPITTELHKSC